MTTTEGILAFTFASGLVQGSVLGPAVASLRGVNRRATGLLSAIILCFLPMIAEEFVGIAGLIERFPHTLLSSTTTDFLLAPLLLFYARAICEPERPFVRSDLLHGMPFAIATLLLLPFYTLSGAEKIASLAVGTPEIMKVIIPAKVLVAALYLTLAIRTTQKARATSSSANPHITWFFRILVVLALAALLMVVLGFVQSAGVRLPVDSDSLGTLFICVSIYCVCLLLIRHPFVKPNAATQRPKYETSPLRLDQKADVQLRLLTVMDREKPFLDPELSLEQLAGSVGVHSSHLSQVLNEQLAMNFYEFVNSYRVREVRDRLAESSGTGRTILGVAFAAGFNSKASFNRAFKRMTGQTPSEYAKRLPASTHNGS
jgi:AraC-like DNA-binding protein